MVALNALAQDGQFVRTGGMVTGRSGFSATLLKDGRVLIAGGTVPNGNSSAPLSSAEIYDPATGRFRATGKMATARPGPQAVALQDGRVLIMEYGPPEIFDPATERFTPVGLDYGRDSSPTGGDYFAVGSSIRRYDPTTNLLSYIGNADAYGDAVVLPNQRVVSAGPENISIYEVRDGALFLVKRHPTGSEWYYRSATRLADGTVLISGGSKGYDLPTSDEALVFDPRKDSSKSTGMMLFPQEGHATTVLADGRVLISGGYSQGGYDSGDFPGAELYDASTGQFTSAGGEKPPLYSRATRLLDGRVLITSGRGDELLYVPPVRATSAASLQDGLAPGSLASLFGSELATASETADLGSLPVSLAGIRVLVRDSVGAERPARLLYASPAQINFEVPTETAPGDVTLTVVRSDGNRQAAPGRVGRVAPGLFTLPNSTAPAAYALRPELDGRSTVLSVEGSISPGDRPIYLTLYATGVRNRTSLAKVQCDIDGVLVPVDYAGPEGNGTPGVDQVNLQLPAQLRGRGIVDLILAVDGIRSNPVSLDLR